MQRFNKQNQCNVVGTLEFFLGPKIEKLDTQTLKNLSAYPLFLVGTLEVNKEEKFIIFSQTLPKLPISRNKYLRVLCDVLGALWHSYFSDLYNPNEWEEHFKSKLRGYLSSKEERKEEGLTHGYWVREKGLVYIDLRESLEEEKPNVCIRFSFLPKKRLNPSEYQKNLIETIKSVLRVEIMRKIQSSLKTRAKGEKLKVITLSEYDKILQNLKEKKLVDENELCLADFDEILSELWPKGEKKCPYCGRFYIPKRKNQYCCGRSTCRSRARREKLKKKKEDEEFYKKYGLID